MGNSSLKKRDLLSPSLTNLFSELSVASINRDSACNGKSHVTPTFYDWSVVEHHEDPSPLIWVSTVAGKNAPDPALAQFTFEELESHCSWPEMRNSDDGPAFGPCTYLKPHSSSRNDTSCSFIAFAIDQVPSTVNAHKLMACISDIRAFCFSTRDHKFFANLNSYCLVIQLAESVNAIDYMSLANEFAQRLDSIINPIDYQTISPIERVQFPYCTSQNRNQFEFASSHGVPLDISNHLPIDHVKPSTNNTFTCIESLVARLSNGGPTP